MSISEELGTVGEVDLPQGRLLYRGRGEGPPVLLLHGLWVNGDHWRRVVPLLAQGHRCITPDLPLGGHARAMRADADLSPRGVAQLIADLIEALELGDVTVVANDTADAIAQVLVTEHPERVGALVLTPGDAFTNFLPYVLKPMRTLAFVPGGMLPAAFFWRSRVGQRLLWWFLAKNPPGPDIGESYFGPAVRDRGIRRDLAKFVRGAGPSVTMRAARRLRAFDKPALVIWTRARRIVFPPSHGRRLAGILPRGWLVEVSDSYAFVPEDQPALLADMIASFVRESFHQAQPGGARAGTVA
jgi:pimeloyl-ACP methyl ester carboxylesterase